MWVYFHFLILFSVFVNNNLHVQVLYAVIGYIIISLLTPLSTDKSPEEVLTVRPLS